MSRPLFLLLVSGCAPPQGGLGSQPAIQAHLVVHVDPMVREDPGPCEDEDLARCGALSHDPWRRRTQNLTWLAEEWVQSERTVDIQLGPEAALAWAGHPASRQVLQANGDDPAETEARGFCALQNLVGSGRASLGLHMHSVLPDGQGRWGEVPLEAESSPCDATRDDPIAEVDARLLEELVYYGATAVDPLAQRLGVEIESFTAHVPRSMAGKIAAVEAPDSLDPDVQRIFPETFQPATLGSAYAECYQQVFDHPPLEVFPADPVLPLAAGQGPPVIPGNRVVGSMAEHLGAPQDGSAEAAQRRLLQLLLNWRVAGLEGQAPRPWAYTFHAHLFDLGGGRPNPERRRDRQRDATTGQMFRGDVRALAGMVDTWAQRLDWRGVGSDEGVLRWSLPRDLSSGGSQFSSGASQEGVYLPLVMERLAHSHLACSTTGSDEDVFVLERCSEGWVWGDTGHGYHCADLAPPETVTVVVADGGGCFSAPTDGIWAGAVDGASMTAPALCSEGVDVPPAGLIVERKDGRPWLEGLCDHGLGNGD